MKKTIIVILALICALSCFVACGGEERRSGIKVVYELEGGTYSNSADAIETRYRFEEGAMRLIKELNDLIEGAKLERQGYRLEGWYTTKEGEGENVAYSNKWDFRSDTVDEGGVTLYAKWVKITMYRYAVYAVDSGAEELIGVYETEFCGIPFSEEALIKNNVVLAADNREGYTFSGEFFEDAELTIPLDETFEFEESEADVTKKIYAKYIEGSYKVVKTAEDVKNLVDSNDGAYEDRIIYLANDINLGGSVLNLPSLFATSESGKQKYIGITGAGGVKTISNFKVSAETVTENDYDGEETGTVRASLLGDINGITVKNVAFKDVALNVKADRTGSVNKVITAPLCGSAQNCTFENVTVEITSYKVTVLLNDPEIIEAKEGELWFKDSGNNKTENCQASLAERQEE